MKKITLLSTICFLLFIHGVKAQNPPNAFNYSAVARNAGEQPIATTLIGIQITILKTSPTGVSQYSENHFVTTDAFGLFNLVIGAGDVQSGSMASIDWSNDNYYLKVSMDVTGAKNFLTMGTSQLLSVPYALHAKTAESLIGGGGTGGNFTHFIGKAFGGGVIFHLWKDEQGVEHGLIVDKTDLSTRQTWSNKYTLVGPSAKSTWDGLSNSNAIVNQAGHTNSAAALCLNSTNGGQSDWYLPAIDELSLLWQSRFNVNKSLSTIGGATDLSTFSYYWSSTEDGYSTSTPRAWNFSFQYGISYSGNEKHGQNYVRAIRAF